MYGGYTEYVLCSIVDKFFRIHLRHKTFLRRLFTEFECKVDVQNHEFGLVCFQNWFFKLLDNDDKNVNKILCLEKIKINSYHRKKVILFNN